ncbi:hypothetical protein FNV43_RR14062 [Rhamnella rubrinervis]|uniref:DUF3741 domain-containing protein n=1 Tax=Rhamnella rubrinervis TaxID=2594499 RepID=A0A8K0H2B2_9ROSA|nr:hypothetical protein FNV43_RR14062 [Rhamnella rubrinervis]
MKDLSLILLKNSVGAKMKKGIRNFCNGDASTSTLNQQCSYNNTQAQAHDHDLDYEYPNNYYSSISAGKSSTTCAAPTLEEMILKLEVEEENARQAKLSKYGMRRMSCVNINSDSILMSARNALNQYPRFSLDGKDAMYRSSFRNLDNNNNSTNHVEMIKPIRKSVCCSDCGVIRGSSRNHDHDQEDSKLLLDINYNSSSSSMAATKSTSLAGPERPVVEWCKPGVVAKLMGLDAMPVPLKYNSSRLDIATKGKYLSSATTTMQLKRQNLRRQIERRLFAMDTGHDNHGIKDYWEPASGFKQYS